MTQHSEPHRQREAWLPRFFSTINGPRTRQLIPQLEALTRAEKLEKAIHLFRALADEEPDPAMKPSRSWSIEYFEACAEGSGALRQFLADEGVLGQGSLKVPARVQPQMEVVNLDPAVYPESLRQDVADLTQLMFCEFFGVKSLLSFPEPADIWAWLAANVPFIPHLELSPPHLKLSLLLRDYVAYVVTEAERNRDLPLVAVFGPGNGEELVPLIDKGLSVVCLDALDQQVSRGLFRDTFGLAPGVQLPDMVVLGDRGDVDTSAIRDWQNNACPPTVFFLSNVDVTADDLIPESLLGAVSVASAAFLLHELRDKEALFTNMSRITRGSVVLFDGVPSVDAIDNAVLPVAERNDTVVTGHDAVISYLLSLSPQDMEALARRAVPDLEWKGEFVGPPIPPPLFEKLQGAVIGRRPE